MTEKIAFDEPYFGYKMNADGTHTGASNPIRDSERLQAWIKDWVEIAYELRVTDSGDCTVMQIVKGEMIFPPDPTGRGQLVWDNEKHDWGVKPPATPNAELAALFAAAKESKGTGGRFMHCIQCKAAFTDANTHSAAGWKETQISGFCEDCFDNIFAGDDDEHA